MSTKRKSPVSLTHTHPYYCSLCAIAIVRACGNQRRFSFYNARLIARSRNRCTWACCIYRRTHSPPLRALARFMRTILSLACAPLESTGRPGNTGIGCRCNWDPRDRLSFSLSLSLDTHALCLRARDCRPRTINLPRARTR